MDDTVILCVDGDASVRTLLQRDIKHRVKGCLALFASDGASALRAAQTCADHGQTIALVLTAHTLPDVNGHTLIQQLKDLHPEMLAILLADGQVPAAPYHLNTLYRCIPKPWTLEELLFAVSGGLESFHRCRQLNAQTEALRDSDQHLRAVIERAADGILTIDHHGIIQSANPAMERIFGYPLTRLLGSNVSLLMPVPERDAHDSFISAYIAGGPARAVDATREVIGQHADGSPIPLEVSVSEFSIGSRRLFSGILRDISERCRLEQLAREKALAERQAAAKSEFFATMSHEIRTPMNGVLGMLELLETTSLNGEQANLLGICRDSAQYLLTIIDDILDFSKIDAGKLQFDYTDCKLDDLIFSVSELLCSRAWAKDLELVSFVDNTLPASVICDPARIRQILINLVGNAVKFTHQGQVSVRARPIGSVGGPGIASTIRFEVMDTGIGLDSEQISRLFRPFEQAEAGTTRRYGGTGLGLAISRRLVEMMNGRIGVTSTPGFGSTFWFEIPLEAASLPPPRPRLSSSARILLVAANPIFRDAVERGLSAAGARVETVDRFSDAGTLAQHHAQSDPFHLVVVEDGCAASHGAFAGDALLKDTRLGDLPVLLLARRDRGPINSLLKLTGADFGLSRPARPGLLLTTVKVALGQESSDALDREQIAFLHGHHASDTASLAFLGGRILVAEDTPTSRLVVTKMLQRMGLDPVLAEDGERAWQALQHQSFDLLITDCHMPELDGFGLCERIRRAERQGESFSSLSHLPIIALSAGVMDEEKARCMDAGMDGFLAKPVESKTLRNALLQWLPRDYHPSTSVTHCLAPVAVAAVVPESPYTEDSPTEARELDDLGTAKQHPPLCHDLSLSQDQQALVDSVLLEVEGVKENVTASSPFLDPAMDPNILDLSIYLELFGEIGDDVRSLLSEFITGAEDLARDIISKGDQQPRDGLDRLAHRLAGAALTAGALELGRLCRTLEQDLKLDKPDHVIRSHLDQVPLALKKVQQAIHAL